MILNRQNPWAKRLDRFVGIPLLVVLMMVRKVARVFAKGSRTGGGPNILVLKLSALGDGVVMMPMLYSLLKRYPEAQITILGGPSNEAFFTSFKILKRFARFSKNEVLALRRESFDLVIDCDQWVRTTALISALIPSARTAGFKSPKQHRHFAFDIAENFNPEIHSAQNFWNLGQVALRLLKPLPEFILRDSDDGDADFREDVSGARNWSQILKAHPLPSFLKDASEIVVIHPGCGDHGTLREWPIANWRELVEKILVKNPQTTVVVTGQGVHEEALAEKLVKVGALSLVNRLSFLQLGAVLSRAKHIVSCNTGVMHLGSFLNDNIVVLNGPTRSQLWGPLWGGKNINSPVACAPCLTWGNDYGCSDPVCLEVIAPKRVIEALDA